MWVPLIKKVQNSKRERDIKTIISGRNWGPTFYLSVSFVYNFILKILYMSDSLSNRFLFCLHLFILYRENHASPDGNKLFFFLLLVPKYVGEILDPNQIALLDLLETDSVQSSIYSCFYVSMLTLILRNMMRWWFTSAFKGRTSITVFLQCFTPLVSP